MKKYLILSGVVAIAALSGVNATAQISYQNGDMLAAFGKNGSSVDVIVDLGSIAQFQQYGAAPISFAGVSSALTATFGGTSGLYWAVFGVNDTSGGAGTFNASVTQADPNTIWGTLARSNPNLKTITPSVSGNSASQANALGDIQVIAYLANGNTALSPNIVTASTDTQLNGFTPQMVGGVNAGNLNGDWSFNMLNNGAGTSDLYQSDPSSSFSAKQTYLGNVVLGSTGNLTFNPVPEPTTIALVGGGLLALLAVRRRNN